MDTENTAVSRPLPPNTFEISGSRVDPTDVLLYALAFFIPPLPVVLRKGFWSTELLISLFITVVLPPFIFGPIYACYIIYDTSAITGSEAGIASRYNREARAPGYDQLDNDLEANPEFASQNRRVQNSTVVSPIPQHVSQLPLRDDYSSSLPSSPPQQQQASNDNKFTGAGDRLGEGSSTDDADVGLPPSYDDVFGGDSNNSDESRPLIGDHKIQSR
ncbi:hypothetical protein CANARDRAFT_6309 [[Candida] arabinofermentans NRRL YB-2248]|uniref:Uncharacterized protein n=1 Tax=[Candida] arabinofermentans NRRL YB-2248 TaxID=983967 RepID=A0A1E4T4P3_9ASCO|nr:hypothetical protein CANARDRAFT_6309 [[Candida] arabinofermentans NRRL YB-2248]